MEGIQKLSKRMRSLLSGLLPVFYHKDYTLLFIGQLVSNLGNTFNSLALAWLVKILTGSTVLMGLVLAVEAGTAVLAGLIAGAVVDRSNKRLILILSDAGRAVIVALFVLLYSTRLLRPWLIVLVAALMGIGTAMFSPARQSVMTRTVESSELSSANSFAMVSRQVSMVFGPALAGVSVSYWGIAPSFWIDSASYAVSIASVAFMRPQPFMRSQPADLASGTKLSLLKEIGEGFSTMIRHRLLKWVFFLAIVGNFLFGPVPVLLPFYVERLGSHGAAALGYIEGAMGLGMLLSAIFTGLLGSRLRKGIITLAGVWGMGLSMLLAALSTNLATALAAFWLFGWFNMWVTISMFTIVSQETPPTMQGRVFSILLTTLGAALPVSQVMSGALGRYLTIPQIYVVVSVLFLALAAFASSLRSVREVR
ncbi:MAG: MFS transporter [Bacilli bacterium]